MAEASHLTRREVFRCVPGVIIALGAKGPPHAAGEARILALIDELETAIHDAGWAGRWSVSLNDEIGHHTLIDSSGRSAFR